jgi:hypothetical protein
VFVGVGVGEKIKVLESVGVLQGVLDGSGV